MSVEDARSSFHDTHVVDTEVKSPRLRRIGDEPSQFVPGGAVIDSREDTSHQDASRPVEVLDVNRLAEVTLFGLKLCVDSTRLPGTENTKRQVLPRCW